ncbi:hypothetical protein, partial [Rhizobium anhuiense]|uniref:hypothetical protein n=1 Tax=Rhizobium anhuiense TaxID=1184720 RepID=UPI001AECF3D6
PVVLEKTPKPLRENPFLRGHVQRANPDETIPSARGNIECARRQSSFKTLTFGHPKRRRCRI